MKPGFYPEEKETFRFREAIWKPVMRVSEKSVSVREIHRIIGPLCLDCKAQLRLENSNDPFGICPICARKHDLKIPVEELRQLANIAYQARLDGELDTISLDSPLRPIKDRDEDDEHWVEIKLGYTSDGRKIAVAYVGNKKRGGKVQSFIDLDNEQLRIDRANEKPHEIIAKLVAEFLHTKHRIEKK